MKKEIGWHSPKEYQEPHSQVEELNAEDIQCPCECSFCTVGGTEEWCIHWKPDEPRKRKKRKSKYCKKLKGPHQYGDWKQTIFNMKPWTGFYERFCKGCNRKDTWTAPTLPGIYWRLDPDARPPLDK